MRLFYFMIFLMIIGCGDHLSYEEKISKKRSSYQKLLRESSDSPLVKFNKDTSKLDFFSIDPLFVFHAKFEKNTEKNYIKIITNDGKSRFYLKYGYATFSKDNQHYKVLLLKQQGIEQTETLFLPFTDLSNGHETYSGGRYLDIPYQNQEFLTIDFNMAYNPYCAYASSYSCPVPPKENHLPLHIRAGEKKYEF